MTIDLSTERRIHFIGIGGSGMGGIAEVLLTQGHVISGSDSDENSMTQRLVGLGATVYVGHDASHVGEADIVVFSSAIGEHNPEMVAARENNRILIPRAKMLAALMARYFGIAIAGTHGKTTTTSLVSSILAEGGLDPTFVIGGLLKSVGCNAQLGMGQYFVAEADESDGSFLFLDPKLVLVTNIDKDHLGTYEDDFERLKSTFLEFMARVPDDGLRVLCLDDPVIAELLPKITGRKLTYGFDPDADLHCVEYLTDGMRSHFTVRHQPTHQEWKMTLNLPGRHNVENAMGAIAVAIELGLKQKPVNDALASFAGVGRRLQMLGEFATGKGYVAVVDDYGHHPREIAATLSALRDVWPDRRVVMVFQPHRYTRTQSLWTEFVEVLQQPEKVMLLDIYPASESEIEGVSSSALSDAIGACQRNQISYLADQSQLMATLQQDMQDGDVILMQGAGTIGRLAKQLAQQMHNLD